MSKNLFIVESPNKCNKIKSYLGSDYTVIASVGHIREIPKKGMNVDIKGGTFEPMYEISKDKKDVVKKIKEEAQKADVIYLASDPDREGSAIAYSIYENLDAKCKNKCLRVMFNEINKNAILKAITEATKIEDHMDLIHAAKARQVLDRLIGYKVSPLLIFGQHIKGSSAGRVQSVALKIVCDRQREVDAFKPEDYWFVEALLKCKKGEFWSKVVTKEKDNRYTNEKVAQEDLEKLKTASFKIDSVEKSEKKNNPYPPFDTNSLQATCSSIFGWSLKKSQFLAQHLYESGKVTYIRSDSFNIAQEALDEVRNLIKAAESETYLPKQANVYTKKSSAAAQEAHECIRPTHVSDMGDDIEDEGEKKMYKLIRDRFIACQMTPQIVDVVVYKIKASSDHDLIARGQTVKFDGWTKAYKYSKIKEEILPPVENKEPLDLKEIKKTKHSTQPPARYNEGTLAKAMEKEGVGRPSTRAQIITELQSKEFVEKDKKSKGLIATILGLRICDWLQPNFSDFFMDIKYTASLEEDLNEIAKGKKKYLDIITSVYKNLQEHIKKSEAGEKMKEPVPTTGVKCVVCKEGEIAERTGRFGKFYSCNKYPECKTVYIQDEEGKFRVKEKKEFKTTGRKCPECEKKGRNGELVERKNKSDGSSFYGCSKFPGCRYSEALDGSTAKPKFKKKSKEDFDSETKDEIDTENKEEINLDFLESSDSK